MPRLTRRDYIAHHNFLKQIWDQHSELFAVLPVKQQWEVHRYYQLSHDLSEEQLVDHRKTIEREDPSLPQRASKAYARLDRAFRYAFEASKGDEAAFREAVNHFIPGKSIVHGKRRIRVGAVVKPEINLERFARALIELTEPDARHGRGRAA